MNLELTLHPLQPIHRRPQPDQHGKDIVISQSLLWILRIHLPCIDHKPLARVDESFGERLGATACDVGLDIELGAGRGEEGDGGTYGQEAAVKFLSHDEDGVGVVDGVSYGDAAGAAGFGCIF